MGKIGFRVKSILAATNLQNNLVKSDRGSRKCKPDLQREDFSLVVQQNHCRLYLQYLRFRMQALSPNKKRLADGLPNEKHLADLKEARIREMIFQNKTSP